MRVVGGSPHHAARVLVALSVSAINRVNRSSTAERTAARVAGSPLAMTAAFGRPMDGSLLCPGPARGPARCPVPVSCGRSLRPMDRLDERVHRPTGTGEPDLQLTAVATCVRDDPLRRTVAGQH